MNFCAVIGRLTVNPDLKTTPEGRSVCTFQVAVKKSKDDSDFFSVVAFKSTAEFIRNYFKKGDLIEIQGKLTQRRWESNGQRREKIEIVCGTAGFVPQNKEADAVE